MAGKVRNSESNNDTDTKEKVNTLLSQIYANIALLFLKYSLNNDCIM